MAVAGCAPAPQPTPAPTPLFTSEADAFAAAEATYRAYNDALNAVDPADPETFENTYRFTGGAFQASDKKNFTEMHADHLRIEGESVVLRFVPRSTDLRDYITAVVCIDVSEVDVIDSNGVSVVNDTRPDTYAIEARFVIADGHVLLDDASRTEETPCAIS